MKSRYKPIPKDIGDYISYSEESSTGLVNKVHRTYHSKKGQEIGYINRGGYYYMMFEYKFYKNHRVIYFLNTGIDPEEKHVDHIDGNKLNNKISNLRLATSAQNLQNRKKSKNNTSGVTGVFWNKSREKYEVQIYYKRWNIKLGYFCDKDKDKAIAVRIAAETDPRFRDQKYRNPHNDEHAPSPEMLVWAKQYLEDRIERLGWVDKYNLQ